MPTMTYPSGHVVKGRAEGSVNPCDLCERIVISLTTRLRKLLRAVEEGTAATYRQNQRDPPPVVDYIVFFQALSKVKEWNNRKPSLPREGAWCDAPSPIKT